MTSSLRLAAYTARRKRLAPFAWGLPLGLLSTMIVAVFPSIERSEQLDELIDAYPESLKEAFGISDASFRTIEGYLGAEVFSLIAPFAAAYFVIHALAGIACGGARAGVLDVLLSAPFRRRHLFVGAFAGTASVLLAILLLFGALTLLGAVLIGVDLSAGATLAGVLSLWPLGMFFGGLALLLAGVTDRAGVVMGGTAGALVVMYLLEVLGKLSDAVGSLAGLSAFHYYGSAIEDGIDPAGFGGLVVAGLVLTAIGCALFERRDVR
jgi:ABC-2 type transport system permease protein